MIHTQYQKIKAFIAKDGSKIRELIHPDTHGNRNQSLAEAMVQPGATTALHKHIKSEEIYHIIHGEGQLTLGEKTFPVASGDTVAILPGTSHCIENTGTQELHLLCCCAPAYSDDDTELV